MILIGSISSFASEMVTVDIKAANALQDRIAVRMYQPKQEIVDGSWSFPKAQPTK